MYDIVVPVPPSNNHRLGRGKYGIFRKPEATQYQEIVQTYCSLWKLKPLEGDLKVEVVWYRKEKKGDIMERMKDLFDALEGYAYGNDRQVSQYTIIRSDEEPHDPRVRVRISKMSDTSPSFISFPRIGEVPPRRDERTKRRKA